MNKLITTHVEYRGKKISVHDLKDNSNIEVEVECKHGKRLIKWNRRYQLCKKCATESGVYNTSKIGRKITWGDKISDSKIGVKFSEKHKESLNKARIEKYCKRIGINENEFDGFPTSGHQYKLRNNLMSAIGKNITKTTINQQDKYFKDILDYSIDDLKNHLESKFYDNMSWDNYGHVWHIDHVRPESWYKYNSTEDIAFKECWALSNLQPMLATQNIKKNNNYEGKYKEKVIYMLCGQFGSGKTTICSKLTDKFTIVESDKNKKDMDKIIRNNCYNDKPLLIDIPTMIITFYERYKNKGYKVIPIFIVEDISIIIDRIKSRNGKVTDSIYKRNKRILSLSKKISVFSGIADDVYDFLVKLEL